MKKQVLSFNEFVFEAYRMLNEGRTWQNVKSFFTKYMNKEELLYLDAIEKTLKKDSRGSDSNIADMISNYFGNILGDELSGKYLNVEEISISVDSITYDKCIGNMFNVTKEGSPLGQEIKLKDEEGKELNFGKFDLISGSQYMKITDFLNMINILNMGKLGDESVYKTNRKGRAEFDELEKEERGKSGRGFWKRLIGRGLSGTKIEGSGSQNNYYITANTDNIEIKKWTDKKPFEPLVGTPVRVNMDKEAKYRDALFAIKKGRLRKKAGKAAFTFVLYAPSAYKVGGGTQTFSQDIIITKVPQKPANVTKTIVIQDPDSLIFSKGSTSLTEKGGQKMYLTIMSQFDTVSSIEITGYASYEGTIQSNLKLAKGRADAANTFLSKYFEGVKTINPDVATTDQEMADQAKEYIQPAGEITGKNAAEKEKQYKPWRKISLKIAGTTTNTVPQPDKEVPIKIVDKVKYDLLTLQQITITLDLSLDPEYARRKATKKAFDDRKRRVQRGSDK